MQNSSKFTSITSRIFPPVGDPTITDDEIEKNISASLTDLTEPTVMEDYLKAFDYTIATEEGEIIEKKIERERFLDFMKNAPEKDVESAREKTEGEELAPERDLPDGAPLEILNRDAVTRFPFRTFGRIATGCTGTLVGPRQVLTAAHCVYDTDADKYYRLSDLTFSRGQYGEGTGERIRASRVYVPNGYTQQHRVEFDYALIILRDEYPASVGRMQFGYDDTLPFDSEKVNINGYPAGFGFKIYHTDGFARALGNQRMLYPCDTLGGMSGSSVYMLFQDQNNKRVIYGIHFGGYNSRFNAATRINKSVFLQLRDWKRAHD